MLATDLLPSVEPPVLGEGALSLLVTTCSKSSLLEPERSASPDVRSSPDDLAAAPPPVSGSMPVEALALAWSMGRKEDSPVLAVKPLTEAPVSTAASSSIACRETVLVPGPGPAMTGAWCTTGSGSRRAVGLLERWLSGGREEKCACSG